MKDGKEEEVTFGKNIVGAGVTTGVVIAVAVPAIVLTLGGSMPGWMQGLAVIVAVLVGGAVMLTAVFFGIVIPKRVGPAKASEEGDRRGAGAAGEEPASPSAPGDEPGKDR